MSRPLRQSSGQAYAEVIGDPIKHSKSPLIHRFWLEALGIDADYRATHVTPDALAAYIASRRDDPDWRGCNVTLPHKLAVMDLVDDPGNVRASIGAMNTIARDEAGALFGTNTDAGGFFGPLADLPLAGAPAIVAAPGGLHTPCSSPCRASALGRSRCSRATRSKGRRCSRASG